MTQQIFEFDSSFSLLKRRKNLKLQLSPQFYCTGERHCQAKLPQNTAINIPCRLVNNITWQVVRFLFYGKTLLVSLLYYCTPRTLVLLVEIELFILKNVLLNNNIGSFSCLKGAASFCKSLHNLATHPVVPCFIHMSMVLITKCSLYLYTKAIIIGRRNDSLVAYCIILGFLHLHIVCRYKY